jgi:hypothetical protein
MKSKKIQLTILSKLDLETTPSLTEWENGLFSEGKAAEVRSWSKMLYVAELKNE